MKLIDEKKVNEFYQNSIFQCEMECIEKSIEFAETELQNLAVKFAQYCNKIGYENSLCIDSELFETFIQQRKTK